jgi:hypothetical protein
LSKSINRHKAGAPTSTTAIPGTYKTSYLALLFPQETREGIGTSGCAVVLGTTILTIAALRIAKQQAWSDGKVERSKPHLTDPTPHATVHSPPNERRDRHIQSKNLVISHPRIMTNSASNPSNPSKPETSTQSTGKSLSRKQKLEAVRKANQALLRMPLAFLRQ